MQTDPDEWIADVLAVAWAPVISSIFTDSLLEKQKETSTPKIIWHPFCSTSISIQVGHLVWDRSQWPDINFPKIWAWSNLTLMDIHLWEWWLLSQPVTSFWNSLLFFAFSEVSTYPHMSHFLDQVLSLKWVTPWHSVSPLTVDWWMFSEEPLSGIAAGKRFMHFSMFSLGFILRPWSCERRSSPAYPNHPTLTFFPKPHDYCACCSRNSIIRMA